MSADPVTLEELTDPETIVREVVSRSGFMVMIGAEVVHVEPGQVILRVDRSPNLLQFDGLFHGGVIASLADYAGAAAAAISMPGGRHVLTANLNVNYLTAAKGQRLWAEAKCVKTGKRIRASRVEVFSDGDGKADLVAVADVLVSVNTGGTG